MSVSFEMYGHIAVLTIDNPPVNALSHHVRQGLVKAIERVNKDAAIKGAVIIGAGRIFIGGADIKEFGKPPLAPHLPDVINTIEACRVPILAAINGAALGGGLEVALGCRYRVGAKTAKTGLPEVNLGLIPGAGGTQRLPRLIGALKAAAMITTGKPLDAEKALSAGILDAVFEQDLLEESITFFNVKLKSGEIRPALSTITTLPFADPKGFEALTKKTKARARGQLSPIKALEAVEAAHLPFAQGLKRERKIFMDCMASDQRSGLIHSFFAQRQVGKIPGLKTSKIREIKTVTILGAGTMGVGIAMAFLDGGYAVQLFDINRDAQDKALARIYNTYKGSVTKGRITAPQMRKRLDNLSAIFDMQAASNSELIIEAATENMEIKKSIFRELDALAKPSCILASNTSYLDINILAKVTKRPSDVIGMHFFSPANIMKLLEVVRTDSVSDEVLGTVMQVGKSIGKVCVVAGVCDGFIGNRVLKSYRKQADFMIEDGAMPQDVDRAMRDFGLAMGPFQVSDLAGIDIGWHTRRREDATRPKNERYVDIADKLYDLGRLGQKTGAGYYSYKDGNRTPVDDPIVEKLILDASKRKQITRRTFTDTEIQNRILFAMINEGAKILEEGIALRALDIDMVFIHGYGFPAYRGGPMFYGDQIGVKTVYDGILEFAKTDPKSWKPAKLLRTLAKTNGRFSDP
ncbi:MAG: enoyl-CoA hydratase/isomerase family protein [Robiginitomaculum sp.]|nr:enoyl-CoA hydratase/isomerase family protein [Robiginitomaculum sp.]